jgi:hypothetical protein
MPIQIIIGLAIGAAIFYPALRICHRAGLRWPIALIVFIPLAGPLLLLVLLSFMIWPNDPAARR